MWNLNQSMGHTHMLFDFITLNLFLFYVYCLFYENVHALPSETGGELPAAGVTEGFHSQYRWDPNPDPLQEQYVLLTSDLSFQALCHVLF